MNDRYYSNVNCDLLNSIPESAKRILEIGCGQGALAKAYKEINPGVQYIGVELKGDIKEINSHGAIDELYIGDVAELYDDLSSTGKFDCIVYGDVLEHLYNPKEILEEHKQLLSERGGFVISIPNAQHWSMFANLVLGEFPENDDGLFDRTHIRWFTRKKVLRLMGEIGMNTWKMFGRAIGSGDEASKVSASLLGLCELAGKDYEEFRKEVTPLQYILCSSKRIKSELRVVGVGLSPTTQAGMAHVRMLQPLRSLAKEESTICEFHESLIDIKGGKNSVLVWQRPTLSENEIKLIHRLREMGFIIVVEYDDDPGHWSENTTSGYAAFRYAHAVQVSTKEIEVKARLYNPEVKVFNNCIDRVPEIEREHSEEVRVFYGALNREDDWEDLIEGFNKALEEVEVAKKIVVVHDRKFYERLTTEDKEFHPTLQYSEYCKVMQSCDITWLPLRNNEFNRCKSDLKYLEAGARGLACVASSTVYGNVIREKETGLIADNCNDVERCFRELFMNEELRKRLGRNAREWVLRNRLVAQQTATRLEWYRDLVERRDDLDASLIARINGT